MRRGMYMAGVALLAVLMGVLAVAMTTAQGKKVQAATAEREKLEQTLLDLQGQIRQLQSQKSAAERQIRQLQDGVTTLAEKRFLLEGVADASRYPSITEQARDFVPRPSFQELAKQIPSPK